jgi:hypothetical protein
MHTNANHYCEEAVKITKEVSKQFGTDETVMSIVRDSEAICASYGIK